MDVPTMSMDIHTSRGLQVFRMCSQEAEFFLILPLEHSQPNRFSVHTRVDFTRDFINNV